MSADGEQVEDDADRIHKRAEDLEQFIRETLLGAKGSRSEQHLSSISFFYVLPIGISIVSLVSSIIRVHFIKLENITRNGSQWEIRVITFRESETEQYEKLMK